MERHNGIEADPEGVFAYYADAQAAVEALRAQLTALRELVGQWAWNTTNLLGDYRIATVADFNAEWTRRSIWLIEAVQATLPPPQAEQDQQTMYELRQQVEALQRERDEAVEYASRPTWVCGGCGRVSSNGWIDRVIEYMDGTEYEMECPVCGVRDIEEDCASDLVRERDDLQAALDAEREKVKGQSQRAEYAEGKVRVLLLKQDAFELKLSQLQALVRALPKCEGTLFIEHDQASEFHPRWWQVRLKNEHSSIMVAEFKSQYAAETVMALLTYRATMDATTPAAQQRQVHSCEIPGCVSCANPEEGGDGE